MTPQLMTAERQQAPAEQSEKETLITVRQSYLKSRKFSQFFQVIAEMQQIDILAAK